MDGAAFEKLEQEF
jgi:hypothetical protein